jgi:hypothetical protein
MRPFDNQLERQATSNLQEDGSPSPVMKVDGEEPEALVKHGSEETRIVIKQEDDIETVMEQEDGSEEAAAFFDEQHIPGMSPHSYHVNITKMLISK